MKNPLPKFFFLYLTLGMIPFAFSQESSFEHKGDHEQLRALLSKVVTALNERDWETLEIHLADDFAYTGDNQSTITSIDQLKKLEVELFTGENAPLKSMKVNPTPTIPTRFLDEGIGYCYGKTTNTYKIKNGIEISTTGSWTATVVKRDGNWKLAAAHSGVNFYENSAIDRVVGFWRSTTIWALIGGIVLGSLATWLLFRKK